MTSVFALYVYILQENIGFFDTVLCLSAELLQTHADNFTEYALTLGKQS